MRGLHYIRVLVVYTALCIAAGLLIPEIVAAGPQAEPGTTVRKAATLEPVSVVELRNEAGLDTTVRFVAPQGKTVTKDTRLLELDSSALEEKLIMIQVQISKTEAESKSARAMLARAEKEGPMQVEVAELDLAVAEGALKAFDQAEYPLQVKTLEQEIAVAKGKVATATVRLESLRQQAKTPEVTQHLQEIELALMDMQAQLGLAEYKLHLLQTVLHDHKINEFKLAIAQKQLELMHVRHESVYAQEQTEARVEMVKIQYAMELERLRRLEQQIMACKVNAPKDGVVLAATRLERGMTVRDRQVLLRLAEAKRFKLNVRVKLSTAQALATGQAVTLRVDAFPDRSFPARISNMRVLSDGSPETAEALVTVYVDDPSGKLRVGMTGLVEFDLSKQPGTGAQ